MPSIATNEKLTEAFSLALEDRSRGYADLVSNSNAILAVMKKNGGWKTFSGPAIRERLLYAESGTYIRYRGFDPLNPKPSDIFADAEYTPRLAAVSASLSGEDILLNSGPAQILDIMEEKIKAAENELLDRFTEDLHGDGTQPNQIGGLQLAVPTVANTGIYGGIDRATVTNWRTGSYTATGLVGGVLVGTGATPNVHDAFTQVLINHTRGRNGPNMIACDATVFRKFQAQLMTIQRVSKEGGVGQLGFPSLAFAGAGYELDVVLEGGIGSAMPAGTAYFLRLGEDGLRFRYHADRNFAAFGGKTRPVNQDAIVQHVGFMGNLTINNPLFLAKLRDV